MHETPDVPGTNPVTDNPNPNNTQGTVPNAPGTGTGTPAGRDYGNIHPTGGTRANAGKVNPRDPTTGTESAERSGAGNIGTSAVPANAGDTNDVNDADVSGEEIGTERRAFRCADMGFADCRWETTGRSDEDLMNQVERHARDAHGLSVDEKTRGCLQDVLRTRRAA